MLQDVKTTGDALIDSLYKGRKGRVDFVDVPELGFVMIDGAGAPGGDSFTAAVHALYAVSYGAHFALKKATGDAPLVMALEGLWWMSGGDAGESSQFFSAGAAGFDEGPAEWRWRLMMMQLPPINARQIGEAVDLAKAKGDAGLLDQVRYERWAEGPCAQTMHVGPYSAEGPTIAALHAAIASHGARSRGKHHEIYFGDPRRAAPEKLRTLLRQPIAAAE